MGKDYIIKKKGVLKKYIPGSIPANDTLRLPEDVHTIASWCFQPEEQAFSPEVYEHVRKIIIPSNIKKIEPAAFSDLDSLEEIVLEDEGTLYKTIDGVLYTADEQTLLCWPPAKKPDDSDDGIITISENVKCLEEIAFCHNAAAKVVLPEKLECIVEHNFVFCSVKQVIVPESVKKIGEECFAYSGDITVIVHKGSYAEKYCIENGIQYEAVDS